MKNKLFKTKLVKLQGGSVLLEALIAILIFSFGILAISGLQAAMIKNTSESSYRAEASYIAQQEIGRMWSNPTNLNLFLRNNDSITGNRLPNGTITVQGVANNRFNIIVSWSTPGEPQHTFATSANIDVNR